MWGASGLIVVFIIIDAVTSFQLNCVLNYLSEEEDEVGVVVYLGEGSENVHVFEELVNDTKWTWTVINRYADSNNIIGAPGNYLVVAQGHDPVRIAKKALSRLSSFKELWHPSARMIVLLGPMPLGPALTPRTFRRMASSIISAMWNYSVFDTVVMFVVDDVDGGLRLYSANPFAVENRCGRVAEQLIDLGCRGEVVYYEAERNIWRHPSTYPNCTFRVSRREAPPFSFLSVENVWKGADVQFVQLLSARKNFNVVWSERPAPESGLPSESVHQYYDNFTRNGIDLAVGGTVINSRRMYKVTYLRPHAQVSLMYYVADSGNMKGWDILHAMFPLPVWYTLGLSLLTGGICYSIVVEGKFNLKRTKFLHLLAILVTQTIILPKRWRIRMFLLLFLLPLYHISTLHSTALQSYMVHTPKQKPISTEADLRGLNMTVYTSEATRELIAESKVHGNLKISRKCLLERLVTLDRKKNYSILARSLEVNFWRNVRHFSIHPIQPPVSTYAVSLTMGKGSPYSDVVDGLAQRCLEVGLFEKWVSDLTRLEHLPSKQKLYDSSSSALEAIDIEDLECAFLLLTAGLTISAGVFFGEVYVYKFQADIQKTRKKSKDEARRRFKYYIVYKRGVY